MCLSVVPLQAQDADPVITPKPVTEEVKTPENGATVKSAAGEGTAAPAPAEPKLTEPVVAEPTVAETPSNPAPSESKPAPLVVPAAVSPAWVIGIYPAYADGEVVTTSHSVAEPVSVPSTNGPSVVYPCPSPRMSYKDAYDQIPFSRAEYEANPGYRHEAAMELVFGAQRPTTIVKQNMPYFSRYPDFQRSRLQVYPYPHSMPSQFNVNHHFFQEWYW